MGPHVEGKFMVAVGAVVEHGGTGRILLLKRTRKADFSPGIWETVTGRMRQFEELEEALRREVKEEAGIEEIEIVKPLTVNHFFRGEKAPENELILIIYWSRTNTDTVHISEEHEEYAWALPDEALKLVEHSGVRKDIETFIREHGRA